MFAQKKINWISSEISKKMEKFSQGKHNWTPNIEIVLRKGNKDKLKRMTIVKENMGILKMKKILIWRRKDKMGYKKNMDLMDYHLKKINFSFMKMLSDSRDSITVYCKKNWIRKQFQKSLIRLQQLKLYKTLSKNALFSHREQKIIDFVDLVYRMLKKNQADLQRK